MNRYCGIACAVLAAAFAAPALAADPNATAAPSPSYWIGLDYLYWGVRGDRLPALVTTGPPGSAGVLGAPGTTALFGDSTVDDAWRSGARLTAGYWFDPEHRSGVEASVFGLANASTEFSANSSAYPLLARPFFNTALNGQDSMLVA